MVFIIVSVKIEIVFNWCKFPICKKKEKNRDTLLLIYLFHFCYIFIWEYRHYPTYNSTDTTQLTNIEVSNIPIYKHICKFIYQFERWEGFITKIYCIIYLHVKEFVKVYHSAQKRWPIYVLLTKSGKIMT